MVCNEFYGCQNVLAFIKSVTHHAPTPEDWRCGLAARVRAVTILSVAGNNVDFEMKSRWRRRHKMNIQELAFSEDSAWRPQHFVEGRNPYGQSGRFRSQTRRRIPNVEPLHDERATARNARISFARR